MEPLISVIVPIYNMASQLPRCVDSLLNQKCKDIEIVLIDDGSTDGTGVLCTQYAGEFENITAILQENRGVSAARNAGINAARGAYLGFVDSDDWIEPEMYEALLNALAYHGTGIAVCGYSVHRYDGVVINDKVDPATTPVLELEQALESMIHPRGIQGFLCNKLFDRELLLKAGGGELLLLDERIHICEDLLFVSLCVEEAKRVAFDCRPLYVYCVRDYSGPENYSRMKRASEFIALEQLIKSWTGISPALGLMMKRKYTNASYSLLRAAAGVGDRAYIPELRSQIRRYIWPYLRSGRVAILRKARVILTLAFPNLENRIKSTVRGGKPECQMGAGQ